MTAEIIHLRPRDPFSSVVEALDFYGTDERRDQLLARMRPPLDAIGDEASDAFLCTTFLGLHKMQSTSARIFSLAAMAVDLFGDADRMKDRGYIAEAEGQRRLALTVAKWRNELSERALSGSAA